MVGRMLVVLVALAVILLLVLLGSFGSRARRNDETERFHRAAHLTSEWARAGVTQPVLLDEAERKLQETQPERESASLR